MWVRLDSEHANTVPELNAVQKCQEVEQEVMCCSSDNGVDQKEQGDGGNKQRSSLVAKNFTKFFKIFRHIESLDSCMKH